MCEGTIGSEKSVFSAACSPDSGIGGRLSPVVRECSQRKRYDQPKGWDVFVALLRDHGVESGTGSEAEKTASSDDHGRDSYAR
jgi:hypothetical protein